jgi:Ca2+/H+ antiporter, TMEM165/GDT1 family
VSTLAAYLTVFVAAATPWLEVLLVVPAGIVAGLPPIPTTLVATAGNLVTLAPLVLTGDRLRERWRRRRRSRPEGDERPPSGRGVRARRLFDRYGLPGVAALGPLLTGVHVAALVALAGGADRRRTLVWLSGGVVVWAVITAVATVAGVGTLVDRDALPDLGL